MVRHPDAVITTATARAHHRLVAPGSFRKDEVRNAGRPRSTWCYDMATYLGLAGNQPTGIPKLAAC